MKTVHYSNVRDQKGNKKPLQVTENIYDQIVSECNGHYGFGGSDKNSFYVDVTDWNRCLEIVNKGIESGYFPYVRKETLISIKTA